MLTNGCSYRFLLLDRTLEFSQVVCRVLVRRVQSTLTCEQNEVRPRVRFSIVPGRYTVYPFPHAIRDTEVMLSSSFALANMGSEGNTAFCILFQQLPAVWKVSRRPRSWHPAQGSCLPWRPARTVVCSQQRPAQPPALRGSLADPWGWGAAGDQLAFVLVGGLSVWVF